MQGKTMEGWIKIHRKLLDRGRYSDTNMVRVFLHLLLITNHKENDRRWTKILPGQCTVWRKYLAKTLGLSERSVRTVLTKLKTTNEIAIKTTSQYSIITMVWRENYQLDNIKTTIKTTSRASLERPTNDQQATTTEEYKEWKNDKKKEINIYTQEFEKFRIVYPIKKWKAEAYTARKVAIKNTSAETITKWAQDYATRCRTTGTDKIKRAQGWLNARRWEDEISTPGTDKQKLLEERRAKKAKQEEMAKKTFIWWLLDDETDTI